MNSLWEADFNVSRSSHLIELWYFTEGHVSRVKHLTQVTMATLANDGGGDDNDDVGDDDDDDVV